MRRLNLDLQFLNASSRYSLKSTIRRPVGPNVESPKRKTD